jgi:predicted nucleic acid-binding protein
MTPFLLDSNILVFSANAAAPEHQECKDAANKIAQNGDVACIVPQIIYEFWTVATRPTAERGLGLSPAEAYTALVTLKTAFPYIPDIDSIYPVWERLVVQHSVSGKNGHDARIVAAMDVHGINFLLTYNKKHFARFTHITCISPHEI